MIDLRKIETPIGLLDAETREALQAHGGPYEVYTPQGWLPTSRWSPSTIFGLIGSVVRVASPAPTPDVWPWDAIAHRFKYAARDQNGDLTLFSREPELLGDEWALVYEEWPAHNGGDFIHHAHCLNVTIGTCDWKDSLVVRPGYVEAGTNSAGTAQDARRGTLNASEAGL